MYLVCALTCCNKETPVIKYVAGRDGAAAFVQRIQEWTRGVVDFELTPPQICVDEERSDARTPISFDKLAALLGEGASANSVVYLTEAQFIKLVPEYAYVWDDARRKCNPALRICAWPKDADQCDGVIELEHIVEQMHFDC